MFDTKLFGYDKEQVDEKLSFLCKKIDIQQNDIDYLRIENEKLKRKLKRKKVDNLDKMVFER